MKVWLLKLHRWVALLFALPLVFVLGTGLILSVEPWLVVRTIQPNTLTVAGIDKLLRQHDPQGKARSISYRSYDNTLTISAGRRGGTAVDAATGAVKPARSLPASILGTSRGIHERLLFDLGWLVIASTVAMLVLALLGVLMGWPRFANSLAGWHKAMSWGLLPLIVLSPLTGLLMVAGVTLQGAPAARAPSAPVTLSEAVRIVGRDHDLSSLIWLRPLGGRMVARLVEGGEYTLYAVTPAGTAVMPRNWPRLWHEGNFAGGWSALMNLVISVAMVGLLVTGVWIWARRRLRLRARRAERRTAAA